MDRSPASLCRRVAHPFSVPLDRISRLDIITAVADAEGGLLFRVADPSVLEGSGFSRCALAMAQRLQRRYGQGHLHFITFTCYRRLPLLRTVRARNAFVEILAQVRESFGFALVGYVVMPEHVHLLIGEPARGTPSTVIQVLKQRVSRRLRGKRKRSAAQLALNFGAEEEG
jgi:putative transposase